MNRPSMPNFVSRSEYTSKLEKYCDELEASIKYILLHMQRENLQDECEGCMCKAYCKGEKSVLQEWCENMDVKLFERNELPNCTELYIKQESESKKLKEDHDKIFECINKKTRKKLERLELRTVQKEGLLKDE